MRTYPMRHAYCTNIIFQWTVVGTPGDIGLPAPALVASHPTRLDTDTVDHPGWEEFHAQDRSWSPIRVRLHNARLVMLFWFIHLHFKERFFLFITVNGYWSSWLPWNPYQSADQTRSRHCNEPQNGGLNCEGEQFEARDLTIPLIGK